MVKSVLSATVLSLMACSVAWAVPAVAPGPELAQTSSDLLKIGRDDHDKNHNKWQHGWRGPQAFDDDRGWRGPDRRYRHQYSYRPYDWEDRGCINVGPVWYCS
jgi:hypothetical protein